MAIVNQLIETGKELITHRQFAGGEYWSTISNVLYCYTPVNDKYLFIPSVYTNIQEFCLDLKATIEIASIYDLRIV